MVRAAAMGAPVLSAARNKPSFEWSAAKGGTLKELEQKMEVRRGRDRQEVEAKLRASVESQGEAGAAGRPARSAPPRSGASARIAASPRRRRLDRAERDRFAVYRLIDKTEEARPSRPRSSPSATSSPGSERQPPPTPDRPTALPRDRPSLEAARQPVEDCAQHRGLDLRCGPAASVRHAARWSPPARPAACHLGASS